MSGDNSDDKNPNLDDSDNAVGEEEKAEETATISFHLSRKILS